LKKFGGITSGPESLKQAHEKIKYILTKYEHISSRVITDIMCIISSCIVTGGSRRSASISFGRPSDTDFISIKDYELNPERISYGWAVNNTILFENKEDCDELNLLNICENIKKNGEPGIGYLDNMKNYSRMCDKPDYKDIRAQGCNPCAEQTLESMEVCNLVEVFLNKIDNFDEFIEVLEYAFLYGKIITMVKTHDEKTNKIIRRNRRIGCSLSGIAQFLAKNNIEVLKEWLNKGYHHLKMFDRKISKILNINESIKITSVKPSGTISLLTNASPGVHFPLANYYIRRVRLIRFDPLIQQYEKMGYNIVDDIVIKENVIVEFPICIGENVECDVSLERQFEVAMLMQMYWSDNQTSVTLSFDSDIDKKYLASLIYKNKHIIKCISFLPKTKDVYPQMPYEAITKQEYELMIRNITNKQIIDVQKTKPSLFCDSEKCSIHEL